jgi:hypothetical protein
MPAPKNYDIKLTPEEERRRIISLQQAAELRNISVATLRRNHSDKIIQVSPRRLGMRLADALA